MAGFADNEYLFTSESVTEGHPDKVADQISDGVLDAVLARGSVRPGGVRDAGEHGARGHLGRDLDDGRLRSQEVARETIRKIGYVDGNLGFSADSGAVLNALDKQSPDIAQGVDAALGDPQETERAGRTARAQRRRRGRPGDDVRLRDERDARRSCPRRSARTSARGAARRGPQGRLAGLPAPGRQDAGVRPLPRRPAGRDREAADHHAARRGRRRPQIPDDLWEQVVVPTLPADLYDADALRKEFLVNPTGRFVIGGPVGDAGLTGRKIIVDTYGGFARHGGGAFSGKDPSKVDRSAAYAARWVAKNIVAAGLADRCEVQVAYAIGVAHPVSVMVETFGTEKIGRGKIAQLVDEHFDLRPGAFREELKLHRPIFQKTAAYGHFGRDDADFTWENTDKADALRSAAGL